MYLFIYFCCCPADSAAFTLVCRISLQQWLWVIMYLDRSLLTSVASEREGEETKQDENEKLN